MSVTTSPSTTAASGATNAPSTTNAPATDGTATCPTSEQASSVLGVSVRASNHLSAPGSGIVCEYTVSGGNAGVTIYAHESSAVLAKQIPNLGTAPGMQQISGVGDGAYALTAGGHSIVNAYSNASRTFVVAQAPRRPRPDRSSGPGRPRRQLTGGRSSNRRRRAVGRSRAETRLEARRRRAGVDSTLMPLEVCEKCSVRFEISRYGTRIERQSVDYEGRVWPVVISDSWLARQCPIAPAPSHGS